MVGNSVLAQGPLSGRPGGVSSPLDAAGKSVDRAGGVGLDTG